MIAAVDDRDGRPLYVGSVVRVVGEPDLSTLPQQDDLRTADVFRHILGTYRRVADFDPRGLAELEIAIRKGPLAGLHFVRIEPHLLKLRETRS